MANQKKEMKIRIPENLQSGTYANNAVVAHTREEFIVDFLMTAPPTGTVVSRIILSPSHLKRLIKALEGNMAKYEQAFGKIDGVDEMPPVNMGYSG